MLAHMNHPESGTLPPESATDHRTASQQARELVPWWLNCV